MIKQSSVKHTRSNLSEIYDEVYHYQNVYALYRGNKLMAYMVSPKFFKKVQKLIAEKKKKDGHVSH